jgi:hypothetical protein
VTLRSRLLGQLPGRRRGRLLALVDEPAGQVEHHPLRAGPELAGQDDLVVVGERQHAHARPVQDHVVAGFLAVRPAIGAPDHGAIALVDDLLAQPGPRLHRLQLPDDLRPETIVGASVRRVVHAEYQPTTSKIRWAEPASL